MKLIEVQGGFLDISSKEDEGTDVLFSVQTREKEQSCSPQECKSQLQ